MIQIKNRIYLEYNIIIAGLGKITCQNLIRMESIVEACSISRMTCRIFRVHQINERVMITINQNISDLLSISRLFPFHPELVTRDTPEPRITCLNCIFYCNSIGVR